jgi:hypothetical protein
MIKDRNYTDLFKEFIDGKIIAFSSKQLNATGGGMISSINDIVIVVSKSNLVKEYNLKASFIENEQGDMFYEIKFQPVLEDQNNPCRFEIEMTTIKKIQVYGRPFPLEDFKPWPEIYERNKEVKATEDLFLFTSETGQQLMILFHRFLPQLEIVVHQKEIDQFIEQEMQEHTVKTEDVSLKTGNKAISERVLKAYKIIEVIK